MAFLVLSCRFGKLYVYRYSGSKSLWIFGARNPVRKYVIYLTTNQFFEFFVIFTILVNCILLALNDPPEEAEYIFTAIYTFEMIIKIISRGFILDKFTYLRDPWNWLDFLVVILGYATLAPGVMVNFSGIRTFRVLRALRTISAVEGLKTMVNALLRSMKMLSGVLVLTTFFICVFALIGLQLFSGQLRNRCVEQNLTISHNSSWDEEVRNPDNWYKDIDICGNNSGSMRCPSNYTCFPHVGENPNYGYTSFDNFGWSLLTSFQLLTLDFWEDVYFHVLSSLGSWYIIYFVVVIFFGTFLVFNLMLAVVAVSYQQVASKSTESADQFQMILDAGFNYSSSRCSLSKFVFDGSLMDVINTFPDETQKANVFIVPIAGTEKSPTDSIVEDSVLENENVDDFGSPKTNTRTLESDKNTDDVTQANTMNNESTKARLPPIASPTRKIEVESIQSPHKTPLPPIVSPTRKVMINEDSSSTPPTSILKKYNKNVERPSKFRGCRAGLQELITKPQFEGVIVAVIIINTICLALEYHGMSDEYRKGLYYVNHAAVVFFILEFIIKLIALGVRGYLKDRWNIFDCLVVIISIIEVILELTKAIKSADLTIIRSLRLCRVMKIAKSWTIMRSLLSAMGRSLNALAYLTIILGIILYMFAVVGTQLFSRYYVAENFPSNEVPDWNFINFGHSFLVIFRVLCGEWIELLYDCMLVAGNWTPLFFIAALIIGNFLILNLFLALLLGSMAEQSTEEEAKNRAKWRKRLKWSRVSRRLSRVASAFAGRKIPPIPKVNETDEDVVEDVAIRWLRVTKEKSNRVQPLAEPDPPIEKPTFFSKWFPKLSNKDSKSCNCCTPLRYNAKRIIDHKAFEYFIIFIILVSSVTLAFEDIHLPKKPKLKEALEILNIIFCVIFVIELIIKVIALGFIKYIKNGWNVLDFIIVVASLISILPLPSSVQNLLRTTRSLRALRPLRAVSRWNGMKVVVNSLIRSIPSIANVVLVCLMVWLVFSILGVQFFGGKFYKCQDDEGNRIDAMIVPNRNVCESRNLTWKNSAINFDSSLDGFLALFQIATFEGMVEIMRDAVDATEIDQQPVKQYNLYASIYFIIFVVIGSFVLLNLFISVMIDNFYMLKKQQDDYGSLAIYLSPTQKTWLLTVKRSLRKKPARIMNRPSNVHIARLFDILSTAAFEATVVSLIFVDVVVMMLEHYNQPIEITLTLHVTNIILTSLFTIESILKIIAFRRYFYIHIWNIIDLAIVLVSVTVLILQIFKIDMFITPTVFRMCRVLRMGRLLRYFNRADGIRRLFLVIINASASAFNMTVLLFLIIFIYAVIGIMNFGHVKKTGAFNEIVNFETFGNSISLLLRVSTSAGWNEALEALMIEPPECELYPVSNCPTKWAAVIYFTTYVMFAFLVVVNMHIAIILENFHEVHHEAESGITNEDLEMYYAMWQLYDPTASQFIPFDQVPDLVACLGPPLAIPFPNKIAIHKMDIPINDSEKVHCNNLLQALIRHFYLLRENEEIASGEMKIIIDRKSHNAFPNLRKDIVVTTSLQRLREEKCATLIQRRFRSFRMRRENGEKYTPDSAVTVEEVDEQSCIQKLCRVT